jgi:hypothetical protein
LEIRRGSRGPELLSFWISLRFAPLAWEKGERMADNGQVQTSCGFGVPILEAAPHPEGNGEKAKPFFKDRKTMTNWAENQLSKNRMTEYQAEWNSSSLDGLPGMRAARRASGEKFLWLGDTKAYAIRVLANWDSVLVGAVVGIAAVGLVQKWVR